jgi:PIN domain nuclease of toxin-antitoxin system
VSKAVLDASALLALLNEEPGGDRVIAAIPGALLCAVNHSEVVAKLADAGMPEVAIRGALEALGLEVVPFGLQLSLRAGMLRPVTRSRGLSLGDRACLALALEAGLPVLTTERSWVDLDLGLRVEVVR